TYRKIIPSLLFALALLPPDATATPDTADKAPAALVDTSEAPAKPAGKKATKPASKNKSPKKPVAPGDAAKPAPGAPADAAAAKAAAERAAQAKIAAAAIASDDSPEAKALQKQLAKLTLEKNLIEARLALAEAKRREAESGARLKAQKEQARKNEEKARIETELALASAKASEKLADKLLRIRELETEAKILKGEQENSQAKYAAEISKYNAELAAFQKKQELARVATQTAPIYRKEPLHNGTLHISDRRIALNGAVTARMAAHAIEQINFYNNQNAEHPIFIVIDSSPGGSVEAGFQILKAMESSKAPVYVVVKKFAASMAAVITTLAERSYCYNNTIILHHQMSTFNYGNMSDLEDQLRIARQWYERLATPVARKMGLSLDAFTKQMYAHFASGDWEEFGDNAKKLKWVDNVVDRIVETGIVDIRKPAGASSSGPSRGMPDDCQVKVDEKGKTYIQLPLLDNPFDAWWIYDKRNLYRAQ
ncbi:MAG: ATP-dependent Clp protease proteolytic subunit, partial [Puniceicoccales bacterium]|nr:ATP-dependent Clp protease proteolytic subunit [Puniceicoccales bacterium]